uniref:Uncharacterized protein n=1 Tax=Dromaius novaehollandiae TaxID=8790 RepID=A0A8C4J9J0_DRONO
DGRGRCWPPPFCRAPRLSSPAGPAAAAGALQRRVPRAGWQDGRLVSQITHPSRLVGQSSGGEVPKPQLDTRVRHEPRGGGPPQLGSHWPFAPGHRVGRRLPAGRHSGPGRSPSALPQGAGEHCYYQGSVRGRPLWGWGRGTGLGKGLPYFPLRSHRP